MPQKPPVSARINRNHTLVKGMVGYWPFNEGGGTIAFDKISQKNGLVSSFSKYTIDRDIRFFGVTVSDCVTVAAPRSLPTSFSISLWFNPSSSAFNTYGALAVSTGGGGATGLYWDSSVNSLMFYNGSFNTSTKVLAANKWHHVVFSVSNGAYAFYVDGVFGGSGSGVSGGFPIVYFGSDTSANTFVGRISSVSIFCKALVPSECRQLYVDPFGFLCSTDYCDVGNSTPSGALVGTCAMSLSSSGTLTGSGALAGSSPLLLSPSGTLVGVGAIAGVALISMSPSGTLLSTGQLAGASSITLTSSGMTFGSGTLSGAIAISISPSGTVSLAGSLSGASTITLTLSGTILLMGALAGTTSISLSSLGTLSGAGSLVGTSQFSLVPSGVLTGQPGLSGQSMIHVAAVGTLIGFGQLAGSISLRFTCRATATIPERSSTFIQQRTKPMSRPSQFGKMSLSRIALLREIRKLDQ